jgi:2-haloacid dehalogenase
MYKVVLFDAYGTLLDVDSAAANLAESGTYPSLSKVWPELSALWRSRQLNYSWLRSLSGSYKPFWEITEDALDYAMASLGLDNKDMRTDLLSLYRTLDAYSEVPAMLDALDKAGLPAAVLSNGNYDMLAHAFSAAGLSSRLAGLLSVEDVGVFKPAPEVYELGCKYFDAEPSEILFVSSNGWDAAAAGLFGFHTIWANRSGAPVERLPKAPDHIASDLSYVATHLSTLAS